jgi:hypothetical protein
VDDRVDLHACQPLHDLGREHEAVVAVAIDSYTLEQAEEEISTLRGQVDRLTEILQTTDVQTTTLEATGAITASTATAALPHLIQTDTWHSLGTLANYTVQVARYRLTPDNCIEIDVEVTSAGANAQSTQFGNVPAAQYRPLVDRHSPLASTRALVAGDAANRLFVAAAGGVSVVQQATSTGSLGCSVRIPLD